MNETPQEKRFNITILILVFSCFLFLPSLFFYGIAGLMTLVFAALALQHLIATFRSRSDVCWGAGTMARFQMSRLSRFVLGLWLAYIAFSIARVFILKRRTQSDCYLAGHVLFAAAIMIVRWRDTGRLFGGKR